LRLVIAFSILFRMIHIYITKTPPPLKMADLRLSHL